MYDRFGLLIDGTWRPAADGASLAVVSAATEQPVGRVPAAGSADVAAALAAAEAAFKRWRDVPAWDRARILARAAGLMRDRVADIARLMSTETGKPLAEARGETLAAADQFEWYAEEAKRSYGQLIPGRKPGERMSVVYEPVGVCLALTAWNFPALLPARKIAAALAAGCAVIARPASEAPGACFALAEALMDAGLPAGTLNVLTGPAAPMVAELIASPIIRKVSLTGSVAVGRQVLAQCAADFKRTSMELGGHAPAIVHADADPIAAAQLLAAAKFRNCGQVCISPSRFYVHESIRPAFDHAFAAVAASIVVGDGLVDGVSMGPMIRRSALETALELIADARARGARLLAGGGRPAHLNRGHFIEPTVIADVDDGARIMQEEPFAPVAPIVGFVDEDAMIERANGLPFGLAAYVFTPDAERAERTARGLKAGMVGINEVLLATAEAPFGGVGHSGHGREGGSLGLSDYLEAKYIRHRLNRST
ncbi:MAG: NAD-dependent succinate-semialdehyde dehydrogenase [Ancalomicrobiaceae bacterium]|nr:NAD-dependent succinate-semialdehyde dehydrogenase [Ancalomicrobiaceae bacterium]